MFPLLVLLFPLWLAAAVHGIRSARRVVGAVGVLAAAVLAWFLPLVWLSGGLGPYLAASSQLYGSVVLPTSVFGADLETTLRQIRHLIESVAVGLGPLAFAVLALPVYARRCGWRGGASLRSAGHHLPGVMARDSEGRPWIESCASACWAAARSAAQTRAATFFSNQTRFGGWFSQSFRLFFFWRRS